jgi:hypothetical protein
MVCEIPDCPELDEGRGFGICFRHRLLSTHVSANATPTRRKHRDTRALDRDLEAYSSARKAGLQPEHSTAKASKRARRKAGDFEAAVA